MVIPCHNSHVGGDCNSSRHPRPTQQVCHNSHVGGDCNRKYYVQGLLDLKSQLPCRRRLQRRLKNKRKEDPSHNSHVGGDCNFFGLCQWQDRTCHNSHVGGDCNVAFSIITGSPSWSQLPCRRRPGSRRLDPGLRLAFLERAKREKVIKNRR